VVKTTGCNTQSLRDKTCFANFSFTGIELRTKYGIAFERFNYSLQHISEELSGISPDKFDEKAKILFHSDVLPQIDELREKIGSVTRAGLKGGLATLVGLSAAIATGSTVPLIPAIMLGVAGALTETFPLASQKINLKKKPAYIWHRVTKT
jgi:hypothetical protein